MKNLVLLTITTLFILVILVPEKETDFEHPKKLSSSDSTLNTNEEEIDESVWNDYDWTFALIERDEPLITGQRYYTFDADIDYDELIMNDTGAPAPEFKAGVIKGYLDNGERVDLFIDNDAANRRAASEKEKFR